MATLLFIAFVVVFCKGIKAAARLGKRKHNNKSIQAESNLQTLLNLQAQRDDIADIISDIEYKLDFAPNERTREKLIKDKIRLRGQLATVENKIYKLIH